MNKRITIISIILIILAMMIMMITIIPKKDTFKKDYPQITGTNIIRYATSCEVIDKLESDYSGIIVYGFKVCPWCQAAVKYINEIAIEKGYKEVIYLDIYDMRNNEASKERANYLTIYQLIKDDIGNPTKIFAPTLTVMKNGKIVGYNVATVSSHVKNDNNILPPMTSEQIEELKTLYRKIF